MDDRDQYKVVKNLDEQYSIWLRNRQNAPGWNDEGATGSKAECLAYIDRIWTDMRPSEVRRAVMPADSGATAVPPHSGSDLVSRLCHQSLVARVIDRSANGVAGLRKSIERGYVRIACCLSNFDEEIVTDIGLKVTSNLPTLIESLGSKAATLRFEGESEVDYVRLCADVELRVSELSGTVLFRRE